MFSVSSVVKGFAVPARSHDPAAFVLAFVLEVKHARLFQLPKCRIPEMQPKNLALPRQKVILDIQPVHGLQMPPQH